MPNIIASQILGVSPMVGPAGSIFSMRVRYFERTARHKVNPAIYNTFLRLNNRRKTQCDADFESAGYHSVGTFPWDERHDATVWCSQQFGEHGFYFNDGSAWWFASEADAVLFQMTWC